jgi:predicted amidohydrolase YtcJ
MVARSEAAGFQVAVHAIQEKAILAVLAALEKSTRPGLRHRIEHCVECSPEILERLRKIRPVIVSQPGFLYYGGDRTHAMQPESHRPWFYRFKSLNDTLTLAGSSDSPVSGDYPLMGIYAALARKTQGGQVINADEALSVVEALKMYTSNAAYASFDERVKGTLAPGKLADIVVLNGDPLKASADEIREIKVLMTIAGGEVAWEG